MLLLSWFKDAPSIISAGPARQGKVASMAVRANIISAMRIVSIILNAALTVDMPRTRVGQRVRTWCKSIERDKSGFMGSILRVKTTFTEELSSHGNSEEVSRTTLLSSSLRLRSSR